MKKTTRQTVARRACLAYAVKFYNRFPEQVKDFYGGADEFFETVAWYAVEFIAPTIGEEFNGHQAVKYATWRLRNRLADDLEKIYHLGLIKYKNADGEIVNLYRAEKQYELPTTRTDEDGEKQVDIAATETDEGYFTQYEQNAFIAECVEIVKDLDRKHRKAGHPDRAIALKTFRIYLESDRAPQVAASKYGFTRAAWSRRFLNLEAYLRAEMTKRHPNT